MCTEYAEEEDLDQTLHGLEVDFNYVKQMQRERFVMKETVQVYNLVKTAAEAAEEEFLGCCYTVMAARERDSFAKATVRQLTGGAQAEVQFREAAATRHAKLGLPPQQRSRAIHAAVTAAAARAPPRPRADAGAAARPPRSLRPRHGASRCG